MESGLDTRTTKVEARGPTDERKELRGDIDSLPQCCEPSRDGQRKLSTTFYSSVGKHGLVWQSANARYLWNTVVAEGGWALIHDCGA